MERTPTSKNEPVRVIEEPCPACGGEVRQDKVVGFECADCGRSFLRQFGKLYEVKERAR